MTREASLALLTALLWACGIPVPPDKREFVGQWKGSNVTLSITAEGRVGYHRVDGSVSESLAAPLKAFEGDDLVVGIGPFTKTFRVQKPPHRDGNVWTMVADGKQLVRPSEP